MQKLEIGFGGEMDSGKTTATKAVQRMFPGTDAYRFSDSLRTFYEVLREFIEESAEQGVTSMTGSARPRLVHMLRHSFGSDLGANGTNYIHFYEFAVWLSGVFVPAHGGAWSKKASTADLQALSTAVRRFFGEDTLFLAIRRHGELSDSGSPLVIYEGIRRIIDISGLMGLSKILPPGRSYDERGAGTPGRTYCPPPWVYRDSTHFRYVYLEADPEVRYERHCRRNEKPGDSELSYEQFLRIGEQEAEREIRETRSFADLVINTSREPKFPAERLREEIDRWLAEIL